MLAAIAASTLDRVGERARLGGPAYFIGTAAAYLGLRLLLVTTASTVSRFLKKLGPLLDVVEVGVGETVFEITVRDGGRDLRVLERSRLDVEGVLEVLEECESVLVSTTFGELDLKDLASVTGGRNAVVDVQGFVRRGGPDGRVVHEPRKVFEVGRSLEASRRSVLKGERGEFPEECWEDPLGCSELLGSDVIITDGERPFRVASHRDMCLYELEPLRGIHGEPIGSGDVFAIALADHLFVSGLGLVRAASAASVAASLMLRGRHPWFTVGELDVLTSKVRARLRACR